MDLNIKKIIEFGAHSAGVYALERTESIHEFFSGSSDKFVTKWNLETLANSNFAAQLPSFVYALVFIPSKNTLLAGTFKGAIHIIDLQEKKEIKILQQHNAAIFDMQLASKHNLLFCSAGDGSISVVETEHFNVIKIISLCSEKIRRINLNSDHSLLSIACGDGKIRIMDVATLKITNEFEAHVESVNCAVFHPTKNILLSGGKDAHLRTWDASNNFTLMESVAAHNWAIYDIVFNPGKDLYATASRDKTIKIWDANSFELLYRINKEKNEGHTHSVNQLLWSNYNDYLISAGDDRKVMVWQIEKLP